MTKYVLNSGGFTWQAALKKQYHQELVKGLGASPKFVLCNFAQGREFWDAKFQGYCDSIVEDMPEGVAPSFELAIPVTFAEQCKDADVIYFHGGDDHLLQYWMRKFNLGEIFKDKVVATNSASSDMLATHHWTSDWRSCADGFGILPIKFIPHYQSGLDGNDPRGPIDWQKAYEELAAYGDQKLPIHALKEGEFIIVEQATDASDEKSNDAIAVAPDLHTVIFENDSMRVLKVVVQPGAKAAMHWHPENINYVLGAGRLSITKQDGTVVNADLNEGQVTSSPAGSHAVENTGDTEVRTVQVELKGV